MILQEKVALDSKGIGSALYGMSVSQPDIFINKATHVPPICLFCSQISDRSAKFFRLILGHH